MVSSTFFRTRHLTLALKQNDKKEDDSWQAFATDSDITRLDLATMLGFLTFNRHLAWTRLIDLRGKPANELLRNALHAFGSLVCSLLSSGRGAAETASDPGDVPWHLDCLDFGIRRIPTARKLRRNPTRSRLETKCQRNARMPGTSITTTSCKLSQ